MPTDEPNNAGQPPIGPYNDGGQAMTQNDIIVGRTPTYEELMATNPPVYQMTAHTREIQVGPPPVIHNMEAFVDQRILARAHHPTTAVGRDNPEPVRNFLDTQIPNHVLDAVKLIERWTAANVTGHWTMGGIEKRRPVEQAYQSVRGLARDLYRRERIPEDAPLAAQAPWNGDQPNPFVPVPEAGPSTMVNEEVIRQLGAQWGNTGTVLPARPVEFVIDEAARREMERYGNMVPEPQHQPFQEPTHPRPVETELPVTNQELQRMLMATVQDRPVRRRRAPATPTQVDETPF